jgi:alkylation response protein AidB-like acyl-CoA dehydrogenase/protein-L-isoaspartate O-methyltransferase
MEKAVSQNQQRSACGTARELLRATQRFADTIASDSDRNGNEAPRAELKQMHALGLFSTPLSRAHGGLGLGTESGGHLPLLRILAAVGGGDLALGRLYEGHVNALILIASYGSPEQMERAAQDADAGLLFGVWNTGGREPLRLDGGPHMLSFRGVKTFASGAAFVERPIVTAERDGGGWQMTLPRMDSPEILRAVTIDRGSWRPLGMQASESFSIDFTGARISADDLIGVPGNFYRDPLFRGGAIRFTAVQTGALLRLHRLFAQWLEHGGRGNDPYQIARLGEIALGAQAAALWIEAAAAVAEGGLFPSAGKHAAERMVECANMTRLAVERIADDLMPRVISGIGAHGLLQPAPFERILRDLTMYLRQPAPDATLADVGRASLRKASLRTNGAGSDFWTERESEASLPPAYFESIYEHSRDPWEFETSAYETAKYRDTLQNLPHGRYRNALEIGCSIGVLTAQLAMRCDSLLSIDVSERALAVARIRCAALAQVRFARMQAPLEMPEGCFDLVIVSEVAYYWDRETLDRAATLLAAQQPAGGHLVLVHFTPVVPDYPLTGDEVHDAWTARDEWRVIRQERRERYRLDVLERCQG